MNDAPNLRRRVHGLERRMAEAWRMWAYGWMLVTVAAAFLVLSVFVAALGWGWRKLEVHLASLSAAADAREDLDRLVAAVQAEALEDAATLAEIYVGLSARAARVPRAIRAMVSK